MKKLVFTLLLTSSMNFFAQSTTKEDVEIIQGLYGKSKKELVDSYMKLQGDQATAFYKIYDAYEAERKVLGQNKIKIVEDYGANYASLTNEKADALAKAGMKNNADYNKLFSKYYDKVKKGIGALNAAKFIQLEIYLQTTIQNEIQNAIPFIGEMEKTKI